MWSPSQAWIELWNQVYPTSTKKSVKMIYSSSLAEDVLWMLSVAEGQSSSAVNKIQFFFSRIDGILWYMEREGTIEGKQQWNRIMKEVMQILWMDDERILKHIRWDSFLKKYPEYKVRLNTLVQLLKNAPEDGKNTIKESWDKGDKQHFSSHIRNYREYQDLVKTYYEQKHGEVYIQKKRQKLEKK